MAEEEAGHGCGGVVGDEKAVPPETGACVQGGTNPDSAQLTPVGDTVQALKVSAPVGEKCPRCREKAWAKSYPISHWLLAVFLFPLGLLALLSPQRRCTECGCVYHPKWLRATTRRSGRTGGEAEAAKACWFCRSIAADDAVAVTVQIHRGQEDKAVRVPRCRICQSVHGAPGLGGALGCSGALFLGGAIVAFGAGSAAAVVGMLPLGIGAWFAGSYLGKELAKAKAAISGVQTKAETEKNSYQEVGALLGSGWQMGAAVKVQEEGPGTCPVCEASTSKPGGLVSLIEITVAAGVRSSAAVRCSVCGKWGCMLCSHFHDPGGSVHWKGNFQTVEGRRMEIPNASGWRHNGCCELTVTRDGATCRFGVRNGVGWPMA